MRREFDKHKEEEELIKQLKSVRFEFSTCEGSRFIAHFILDSTNQIENVTSGRHRTSFD
jgi:hypothetical protein